MVCSNIQNVVDLAWSFACTIFIPNFLRRKISSLCDIFITLFRGMKKIVNFRRGIIVSSINKIINDFVGRKETMNQRKQGLEFQSLSSPDKHKIFDNNGVNLHIFQTNSKSWKFIYHHCAFHVIFSQVAFKFQRKLKNGVFNVFRGKD